MLIMTIWVDAPAGAAQGAKEAITMDLEKYGNVTVKSIVEILPKQMGMEEQ